MRDKIYLTLIKSAAFTALMLFTAAANAQFKISGTVVNEKDRPIKGVSVYLDNTIDGATTDSSGIFVFTTTETGNQTLMATEISHETTGMPIAITGNMSGIVLRMKSNASHNLDEVVITAGSFDASNDKTKTVLRPLDIVTTAGAGADVVKAMQTLPGTQQTGPDNGLFVRGGDASEAAIVVDEMIVQNAFFTGAPGVATRSRFGAFQYQGVSFSSGGYSARYGQALSSVLELNSTDLADKSTINLGINMASLYVSGVKKWKNASLDVGVNYTNLSPFYGVVKSNFKFYQVPEGGGANLRYAWKPNKDGILKFNFNTTYNATGVTIPNPGAANRNPTNNPFANAPDTINFVTKDMYYYSNISYKQMFKNKYSLYTAASFSQDVANNKFYTFPIDQTDHRGQFRIEGKDFFTSRLNLLVGTDVQSFGIDKDFGGYFKQNFTETQVGAYTELEWTPYYRIAVKPGVRYEHSVLLNKDAVAPRLSMAIKTSSNSQVSLAGGIFYQNADNSYLLAGLKPSMQQAIHYIANWQYNKDSRTLRIEGYYKNYVDLVRTPNLTYDPTGYRNMDNTILVDNSGYGYAQGLELFYRDKKTVKNLDYWVSYSFIDTKRKYGSFTSLATPTFIADHNLNLVTKYFVDKWQTNFSATYSYATGRPYYDPTLDQSNAANFLSGRTPDYHNLAISIAYLHSFGKLFTVFYLSLDNVTNQHNVFGYRYASDANGNLAKNPIVPALYRSLFFGVNMSLTQFKKDEL